MRLYLRIWVVMAFVLLSTGFAGLVIAQSSGPQTEIAEKWLSSGHADATSPAFTHWDDEGTIPQNCATCHASEGFLAFYGLDGSTAGIIDDPVPTGGVVNCATCHNDAIETIQSVQFPSGVIVSDFGSNSTCITCHQGRQSSIGVSEAVADMGEDEINPELSFINVHYNAAAAMLMGSQVKGGFEYDGNIYSGRFSHGLRPVQCTDCHDPHALDVQVDKCITCHKTDDPRIIRSSIRDFDGDGDLSEGIYNEIAALHSILGEAITAYANQVAAAPIVYDDQKYPHFFNDINGNGAPDADEIRYPNKYASWTPRLLKAAYNYQFVAKEQGAYAHNPHYALQILFDSIQNLSTVVKTDMPDIERP